EQASMDTIANQPFVSSPGQQFWTQSPLSSDSAAQQPTPYAPMVPPTPMQPSQPMLAQQFSQPMPVQPQVFLPPVPVGNNPLQQVFQQQQVVQTPRPTDPWSHSGMPTMISSAPPPRPARGISKRYIV